MKINITNCNNIDQEIFFLVENTLICLMNVNRK
jgi:hypothetical protein